LILFDWSSVYLIIIIIILFFPLVSTSFLSACGWASPRFVVEYIHTHPLQKEKKIQLQKTKLR